MNRVSFFRSARAVMAAIFFIVLALAVVPSFAQDHGRKYKPLGPTAHIVVTVEKGYNSRPLMNAAVIFHAVDKDGKNDGNLEVKTDPDGRATIDVIEIGSHVTVQVIATGFATTASQMVVDSDTKELLVKLERPKAQISAYEDNDGKSAGTKGGTQEHVVPKKVVAPAAGATGGTGATGVTGTTATGTAATGTAATGTTGTTK